MFKKHDTWQANQQIMASAIQCHTALVMMRVVLQVANVGLTTFNAVAFAAGCDNPQCLFVLLKRRVRC